MVRFLEGFVMVAVAAGVLRAAEPILTFDTRPLHRLDLREPTNAQRVWDTMHVLSALQGLANRPGPRLYLFHAGHFGVDTDAFWLDWLRHEDGWLRDREVRAVGTLEEAVRTFRDSFDGLAVYDPAVPATAIVASTAAGCENLLPIRFDPATNSIFRLLTRELQIPAKLWLVKPDGTPKFTGQGRLPDYDEASGGSAKVDAHRWAVRRYLRTGQCAPGQAAYYLDSFWLQRPTRGAPDLHTLANHDYFIANRAFFFDLSAWGDEVPNDDTSQPLGADRAALTEVLRALYDRAGGGMVKIGGFTPWPFKYTSESGRGAGKHGGVETEWEFSRVVSQFNAYVEADAAGLSSLANASFFRHYPLQARYPQPNRKPSLADWKARGFVDERGLVAPRLYVGHYVGDYDAPSWLYKAVPAFFRDPKRGRVPLGWAFNPNLADRVPQALAYAYRQATSNDFFIAGDSGAGYVNPRALTLRPDSGLPSGLVAWTAHCRGYYERWDMTITGFLLDGSAGASTETEFAAYRRLSPEGLGTHFERGPAVRAGIPTCPEKDLPDRVADAAAFIAKQAAQRGERPGFLWARSILKSPRWYADLAEQMASAPGGRDVVFVDPYTFFGLIRLAYEAGPNRK